MNKLSWTFTVSLKFSYCRNNTLTVWRLTTHIWVVPHRYPPNVSFYTGLSKKMDGIWNRYTLKSTGRIYTFCVLKYSEKFKVLDLL